MLPNHCLDGLVDFICAREIIVPVVASDLIGKAVVLRLNFFNRDVIYVKAQSGLYGFPVGIACYQPVRRPAYDGGPGIPQRFPCGFQLEELALCSNASASKAPLLSVSRLHSAIRIFPPRPSRGGKIY